MKPNGYLFNHSLRDLFLTPYKQKQNLPLTVNTLFEMKSYEQLSAHELTQLGFTEAALYAAEAHPTRDTNWKVAFGPRGTGKNQDMRKRTYHVLIIGALP